MPGRPGEALLAHRGILFLDELSEFPRDVLAALRQPLEDHAIVVTRGRQLEVQPAHFLLVAATNPCPCGFAGEERCHCSSADLAGHRRRLSGPLLDRIDLIVYLRAPTRAELAAPPVTTSTRARTLVVGARERQRRRLLEDGLSTNAELDGGALARHLALAPAARERVDEVYATGGLSGRGRTRLLRVARTVADLHGSERVERAHVTAALALRDGFPAGDAATAALPVPAHEPARRRAGGGARR